MNINFLKRIFLFFLQVSIFSFALSLYAQASNPTDIKFTVIGRNITLDEVVKKIEQQSNLRFQMNVNVGRLDDRITCNLKNAFLATIMDSVFGIRGYTWKYERNVIYLRKFTNDANVHLTLNSRENDTTVGTVELQVADEQGKPVPAATVSLSGKKKGAITDMNGRAIIRDVTIGEIILVTNVGFEKFKIAFNGQNYMNVSLRLASNELNEVKVVSNGYQEMPKERATGSFEKIDSKLLNQQVGTNILDRLNGVASGVQFDPNHGNGNNILVRGLSTINALNTPLIVVDNFPYAGSITSINPNDVLSITILKDAAAASIWGARAGNGVIVITTKKGEYSHSLKVNLNSNIVVSNKPDLYTVPQMASSDMVDVETMLFKNGVYNSKEQDPSRPVLSPVVEILIAQRDGKITSDQANAQLNVLKQHDVRNDYKKYIYQPSVNQQYALSVSGGDVRSNYYLSGGYDHDISDLESIYDRVSFRSQYGFKVVKNIDINLSMNYATTRSQSGKIGYQIGGDYPYRMLKDQSGKQLPIYRYRIPYIDTAGGGRLLDWNYYPLDDWRHNTQTNKSNDLVLGANLRYKIWRGLGISLSYQYERQQGISSNLSDIQSFTARNLINRFTQIDAATGAISYAVPLGGILQTGNSNLIAQNARGQINYTNDWGRSTISAILGSEISESRTDGNQSDVYGYTNDPLKYTTIDVINPHPTFIDGSYSYIASSLSDVSPYSITRFLSFYGNASYTYDGKYIVSISGRKDAANIFGANTNDKWKPLWSAGLSWNMAKEGFYQWEFLPILKPRITYGFSGNVNSTRSAQTVIRYNTGAYYTNLPYVTVAQFGDPSLRWESISTLNLGLDFEIKDQILSGSLEYYAKRGMDLYGPAQVDGTAGLVMPTILKNAANMKANGVDIVLNSQNVRRRFTWTTRYLFNFYTDKVTKYLNPIYGSQSYVGAGINVAPIEGRPLYSVITYKSAGLDPKTGDPRGVLNGKPSSDYVALATDSSLKSLDFNGTSLPRFNGSLSNSFSYKGINLDINLVYKAGYKFIRSSINYDGLFNGQQGHSDFSKRWQSPGDELRTTVPSMVYPNIPLRDAFYALSSDLVENGAFVRLQYINLGYDLMHSLIRKSSFMQLQLYFNASNLGIVWRANKHNIDPDFYSSIPTPASFAFGVRAGF